MTGGLGWVKENRPTANSGLNIFTDFKADQPTDTLDPTGTWCWNPRQPANRTQGAAGRFSVGSSVQSQWQKTCSQGSVKALLRCGWSFSDHFTANLQLKAGHILAKIMHQIQFGSRFRPYSLQQLRLHRFPRSKIGHSVPYTFSCRHFEKQKK